MPTLVLSLVFALVNIDLINLYLLMRAQLTVEQHTVDMPGLRRAGKRLGRLSFIVGEGDHIYYSIQYVLTRFS